MSNGDETYRHESNESKYPDNQPREAQPKWRRDFPIDEPEDEYVSRRDFAKFLVLTSGAFVAGHATIAAKAAMEEGEAHEPKQIARLDELGIGGAMQFHYPGHDDPCLLVRLAEDELVAYSQKCTHLSCAVQPEVAEERFNCPCHHAYFDMATGRPMAGPPRRPLPRVQLELRDGAVYATGMELRT